MLGDKEAVATIAVKSLEKAKAFYGGKLGLKENGDEQPGVLSYKSGKSSVLVYESQYAGTNQATAATWTVGGDVDRLVKELKSRGITFEKYDLPNLTHEGDVHVNGEMRVAWFKDPDGNILAIVSG